MSRYKIDHEQLDIAVGWDRALNTFFAIVVRAVEYESDQEDDSPILWLGTTMNEYSDAKEFLAILAAKLEPLELTTVLPQSLLTTLMQDQTVEGSGFEERPKIVRAVVAHSAGKSS